MRPFAWLRTLLILSVLAGLRAAAEPVPLPPPRPPMWMEPLTFREAAGPGFNSTEVTDKPTPCDERLVKVAAFTLMPRLIGPQACGGADMVRLDTVLLPDGARAAMQPAALLTCGMAEAVAAWLRDDAAPELAKLGSPLRAIENYDSYECRSRNRVAGAKLSDHAHGDALDVRSFALADGRRLELTDVSVDRSLRAALRASACRRFTTVLGPGSDGYHEGHVHLDLIQRHNGYRICQWDVREPSPPAAVADNADGTSVAVPLPPPRPAEIR